MVFTHYWDCMWPSQESLAQEPKTGAFPPSAMQGSHGVSVLGKACFVGMNVSLNQGGRRASCKHLREESSIKLS